jgi:hypothetical protein
MFLSGTISSGENKQGYVDDIMWYSDMSLVAVLTKYRYLPCYGWVRQKACIGTWCQPLDPEIHSFAVPTFFPFKLLVEICSPCPSNQLKLCAWFLRLAWSAQPCSAWNLALKGQWLQWQRPFWQAHIITTYINLLAHFCVSPHLLPLHRLVVLSSLLSRSSYTQPIGFDLWFRDLST